MRPILSVQARMGSSRLPGKVLLSLGDQRVIEWVVNRCQKAETIEDIRVTTGQSPENEVISEWCRRSRVECLTGPEDDLLERHRDVLTETNRDTLVRITGDCPFVPPAEVDRVVKEHRSHDVEYTTNSIDQMPIGTAVDVVDADVLDELARLGETHPVRRLRQNPDQWKVRFTANEDWSEYRDAHLAIDTPGDYWRLSDAIDEVGPNPVAIAEWVVNCG